MSRGRFRTILESYHAPSHRIGIRRIRSKTMDRTLIEVLRAQTPAGRQFTILHYVRSEQRLSGGRPAGIHRVDEYVTKCGQPIIRSRVGQFSVLIDGQWIDLVNVQASSLDDET